MDTLPWKPALASLNGLLLYGHSQAKGVYGPALSTAQPYSNLTFGVGPRCSKIGNSFGGINQGTNTSKPLVEDNNIGDDGGQGGETLCSSSANYFSALLARENGIDPNTVPVFASAPGHGGYTVSALSKGQPWYQNPLDHMTDAALFAPIVMGRHDYALQFIFITLGETDAIAGTNVATFQTSVDQLCTDLSADTVSATGQSEAPYIVLVPPASYSSGSHQSYGRAIREIVHSRYDTFLGPLLYPMPFQEGIHLNNTSKIWVGCYLGRIVKRVLIDNVAPKSLDVVSAVANGLTLDVTCETDTAIEIDGDLGTATQLGFAVSDSSGSPTLSDQKIMSDGLTIRATLSRNLASSPVVRGNCDYLGSGLSVYEGTSCNIRNTAPETVEISAVSRRLFDWLPSFEIPIFSLDGLSFPISNVWQGTQFMPTLYGSGGGSFTLGASSSFGRYRIDGNRLKLDARLVASAIVGTPSGSLRMGLPRKVKTAANYVPAVTFGGSLNIALGSGYTQMSAYLNQGAAEMGFWEQQPGGVGTTVSASAVAVGAILNVSLEYEMDDG